MPGGCWQRSSPAWPLLQRARMGTEQMSDIADVKERVLQLMTCPHELLRHSIDFWSAISCVLNGR